MRALLSVLPRPSRYLGIEEGAVRPHDKAAKGQSVIRCALAFPDLYEVGMSYLGQKILYSVLNQRAGIVAERVFAPCREAAAVLREHKAALSTLESATPLAHTDLIGFSVTHELCYTNILYMLDLAGIPLRAAERGNALGTWPVIVAGGGCTLAAEPLAPFVDLMVLGEGEQSLPELVEALGKARAEGRDKAAFLLEAARIPGIYVPGHYAFDQDGKATPLYPDLPPPTRRIVANLDDAAYPSRQVVPFGAVHNRLSLEIARGCTRGCRFCQAGIIYRPARERSLKGVQELLRQCLDDTGFDEVSFLSLSTGDFSALRSLFLDTFDRCASEQISVALPSLRVGSIDDSIMERMAGLRRTGATLAPEAGSQRMRDAINKGITEEQILLHAVRLAAHGWQQVKLYFMIGLPGEMDEDVMAILDLARKVRDAGRKHDRNLPRLQVTVAVSPFVPKAHTPFQWEGQISQEEIERRVRMLRETARNEKGIKLRWHEPAMSFLEGLLSRGDRRLADVVERAYRKGAVFSSWVEGFTLEPWLEAMREEGLSPEAYTGERSLLKPLPWEHIATGVSRAFLLTELERSRHGETVEDCRYARCLQCGVCTDSGPGQIAPGSAPIRNRLNFPERDQLPQKDLPQVIPNPAEKKKTFEKKRPEGTSPELAVKAVRYRIWHKKEGQAAFLSQLELQPLLERAMRRAKLPLAFSQGFHPLPLISFGRALPVGLESLAEWFCVTLRQPLRQPAVLDMLQPCMLQGMALTGIDLIPIKDKTVGAVSERFSICLQEGCGSADPFWQKWRTLAESDQFLYTHETKKGPRQLDLRPMIASVQEKEQGVDVVTDWSTSYLSPLLLFRAVLPDFALQQLRIIKLEQTLL